MARQQVLAISYLFPNVLQPNHGIFVYNRLNALARYVDIKVINPIPWSPFHHLLPNLRQNRQIPLRTQRGQLEIFHPRFFSIPRFLKGMEVHSYERAVRQCLANELSEFKFDLIDLHWTFPDLPTGRALADQYQKPCLVTLRGLEAFHLHDADSRQHHVRKNLLEADGVIALSEELQNVSLGFGGDKAKHAVIRNGVDTEQFCYTPKSTARAQLGLPEQERFILMVGALIKRKGFDLVISQLKRIRAKVGQDVRLRIVGAQGAEGDFRQGLFTQIEREGLQEAVTFQGAVPNEQLHLWYSAADVFCLASRGEGSPNVLTEALACGCPAVASKVGAVPDIMGCEDRLGLVVPNEDAEAIAAGLIELLSVQGDDRAERARAFGCYDWDWCARQVLKVYARFLGDSVDDLYKQAGAAHTMSTQVT